MKPQLQPAKPVPSPRFDANHYDRLNAPPERLEQAEIEEWKRKVQQLEFVRDEWARQNGELWNRLQAVQSELAAIRSSPGWRALEMYRTWLRRNYDSNLLVRGVVDPGVRWILKMRNLWNPGIPSAKQESLASEPAGRAGLPATSRDRANFIPQQKPDSYQNWSVLTEVSGDRLDVQRQIGACFSYRPKISVITPIHRIAWAILRETIASVQAQTYTNWELCLVHADPADLEQRRRLEELAASDSRIQVELLSANEGISGNSNRALSRATGEFVALLDHDDTLAPNALFDVAELLNEDPSIHFIYSDKDQLAEGSGERVTPLFKPSWSPDVMLSANYLTHLCVIRTENVRAVGGWRRETDGAQDWDLFLRVITEFSNVRHLPKVLYHWRRIASSVALGGLSAKPFALAGQLAAVRDYCSKAGLPVEVAMGEREIRVSWLIRKPVRVTVIRILGRRSQESAAVLTDRNFPGAELVEVREGKDFEERLTACIGRCGGEVLVFIDQAVTPASEDWLTELAGPLQDGGIGVVGSKLVDPQTGLLRHCGLVLTREGGVESIYAGYPEHVNEVFGPASWYRNWSAVSGACFALRRDIWDHAMGAGVKRLHPRLDIHICLHATGSLGKRVLYNPYARLYQKRAALLEQSVAKEDLAVESVLAAFPKGDPYFHSQLCCRNGEVGFQLPPESTANAPRVIDYSAESRILATIFDFSLDMVEHSRHVSSSRKSGQLKTVTWFIPEIDNAFYGGIHTILRFADWFQRNRGVRSRFCVIGHGNPSLYQARIGAAFPELAASIDVYAMGHREVDRLPECDAAIATLWTTAYAALHFTKARQKFYFIQDDEALFYPAGSSAALVEATYGFGFHGICNTVSLLKRYRERGGDGVSFTPAINPKVFHAGGRRKIDSQEPYTLFCYGRPGHARNSFELLCAIVTEVKKRFGKGIRIYSAGAPWSLKAYGLENVVENLGLLNYQTTGALYRASDAGLVMMMTRHPSYLPMELMACGALVITNRNPDTAWLLKNRTNCLLAEPGVTTFADQVEEGLRNIELRRGIVEHAAAEVAANFTDWEGQIGGVYDYMLSQC